jgi:hypothetical protein
MPVPGKICFPYVTGHRRKRGEKKFRSGDKKFRRKRAENKFFEFLVAVYRGKVRMKGYLFDPAPPGKAEAYAKKAMSVIKGRGLGELEMFCIADEFDEWWNGQWKIDKEKKRLVRGKGQKHRRTHKGWRKALTTIEKKVQRRKQLEKERQREDKRLERERVRRKWEEIEKPRAAAARRLISKTRHNARISLRLA